MPKFIVMTSKAKMPVACVGGFAYRNVAVVETDGQHMPKQIHPRHRAVKSIRFFQGRLFCGKTSRSAYGRALEEAAALAAELNASVCHAS